MKVRKAQSQMPHLCNDVLGHVFGYLEVNDQISCSRVSKLWRGCVTSDKVRCRDMVLFREIVKHVFMASIEYSMQSTLKWPLSWFPRWIQKRVETQPPKLHWKIRDITDPYEHKSYSLQVWKTPETIFVYRDNRQEFESGKWIGQVTFTNHCSKESGDSIGVFYPWSEIGKNGEHVGEIAKHAVRYVKRQIDSPSNPRQINRIGTLILKEIAAQDYIADGSKQAKGILVEMKQDLSDEGLNLINVWQRCYS